MARGLGRGRLSGTASRIAARPEEAWEAPGNAHGARFVYLANL